jgi:Skp family chaperone for outer membrane proteins
MSFRLPILLLLAVALSAGEAAAEAPKVAVLRLTDAIRGTRLYQGKMAQFKQEAAKLEAQAKELEEQLTRLQNAIEALPPANEKFARTQEELELTKTRRELFIRRSNAEMDRANVIAIRECFQLVRAMLKDFCTERGIKLVVQAGMPEVNGRNLEQLTMQLATETALYWEDSQDITDAFIAFVNARAGEQPAKPDAPPAKAEGTP